MGHIQNRICNDTSYQKCVVFSKEKTLNNVKCLPFEHPPVRPRHLLYTQANAVTCCRLHDTFGWGQVSMAMPGLPTKRRKYVLFGSIYISVLVFRFLHFGIVVILLWCMVPI